MDKILMVLALMAATLFYLAGNLYVFLRIYDTFEIRNRRRPIRLIYLLSFFSLASMSLEIYKYVVTKIWSAESYYIVIFFLLSILLLLLLLDVSEWVETYIYIKVVNEKYISIYEKISPAIRFIFIISVYAFVVYIFSLYLGS
mgnify:CR=1 FL=1